MYQDHRAFWRLIPRGHSRNLYKTEWSILSRPKCNNKFSPPQLWSPLWKPLTMCPVYTIVLSFRTNVAATCKMWLVGRLSVYVTKYNRPILYDSMTLWLYGQKLQLRLRQERLKLCNNLCNFKWTCTIKPLMNIIDVVYRSVWKARTTHEATYEKDARQVRGDERVHSARSTNEHRVAVKYRRRHWPWHVHSDMNRATEHTSSKWSAAPYWLPPAEIHRSVAFSLDHWCSSLRLCHILRKTNTRRKYSMRDTLTPRAKIWW